MKYKALMVDIDGTLAKSQQIPKPSQHVKETISLAKNKIHIGVATGRPLFLVDEIISHLDLSGPCVVNDGGIVIDATTREIYYERMLTPTDLEAAYSVLLSLDIPFFVHDNNKDIEYVRGFQPEKPFNIFTHGVDDHIAQEARTQLKKIPTLHVTTYISWMNNKTGILITHAEATKQHGIFEVAKVLGITTDEIIGIGDGYNDFPLLMACGLKIAMGNAVEELKEIADYVAPTVDDDGVAHVIKKFILNS